MGNKPGVMIYFDTVPVMRMMSHKELGQLFLAIMEYGQNETEPKLTGKAEILWPLIRQRLENDDYRYEQTVMKRRYAAYTRWERQGGNEPKSFCEWYATRGFSNFVEDLP